MSTAPPTTLAPTTAAPGPGPVVINNLLNTYYIVNPIVITLSQHGALDNTYIDAGPIPIVLSNLGDLVIGVAVDSGPINIKIVPRTAYASLEPGGGDDDYEGGFTVEGSKCNWVKWSKIGCLDFTIDESNVAGERPLDWHGCVYELLKLNDSVVAYGSNGITFLKPGGVEWGMNTIHRLGILHKTAVTGTDFEHYFIDITNRLYKLSGEGMQLLDYQEFLELMTNPKLSLDPETGLLYICDGTYGYVYSTKSNSFGVGPANVTGVGSQDKTLLVVGDGDIVVPKLDICTDIYDFGTRKPKTIEMVEVGTDLKFKLHVMIESRISNRNGFMKSNWILVNPSGIAYIPCYGVEFKFNLRSYMYEYIELDYIKVSGVVHGFSYLESIE